jgi:hypothetical protein
MKGIKLIGLIFAFIILYVLIHNVLFWYGPMIAKYAPVVKQFPTCSVTQGYAPLPPEAKEIADNGCTCIGIQLYTQREAVIDGSDVTKCIGVALN